MVATCATITENKIVVKIVFSRKCPWSGGKCATQDVHVFSTRKGNKGNGKLARDEGKKEKKRGEKYVTGCPFVSRCCLPFAPLKAFYSSHLP